MCKVALITVLCVALSVSSPAKATQADKLDGFFSSVNYELEHCRIDYRKGGYNHFERCALQAKDNFDRMYMETKSYLRGESAKKALIEYYQYAISSVNSIIYLTKETKDGYAARQLVNNQKLGELANLVRVSDIAK